jgi:ankyrin repeat protein
MRLNCLRLQGYARTPLHDACLKGHLAIVSALLAAEAALEAQDNVSVSLSISLSLCLSLTVSLESVD